MKIFNNLTLGLATALVATLLLIFPVMADEWDKRWDEVELHNCHTLAVYDADYPDCIFELGMPLMERMYVSVYGYRSAVLTRRMNVDRFSSMLTRSKADLLPEVSVYAFRRNAAALAWLYIEYPRQLEHLDRMNQLRLVEAGDLLASDDEAEVTHGERLVQEGFAAQARLREIGDRYVELFTLVFEQLPSDVDIHTDHQFEPITLIFEQVSS